MIIDLNKILDAASKAGTIDIADNSSISKEILKEAKKVHESNVPMGSPWFRGVDMIDRLKHLGKSNVRTHLERLNDKGYLEAKLFGNKKVYRLKVISEDD